MISHRHRCIFVHIPKCGGTSIEDAIWPPPARRTEADLWMGQDKDENNKYQPDGLQHLTAAQIRKEVGADVFRSYFKFTFVRNPFDKATSQYEYMKRMRARLRGEIGMEKDASFGEYLRLIQDHDHPHWAPQRRFLFADDGELLVDFAGRFERFEENAHRMFDAVGIGAHVGPWRSKRFPHSKGSGVRLHYREYYDDEARGVVAEMYAHDLDLFGYDFE